MKKISLVLSAVLAALCLSLFAGCAQGIQDVDIVSMSYPQSTYMFKVEGRVSDGTDTYPVNQDATITVSKGENFTSYRTDLYLPVIGYINTITLYGDKLHMNGEDVTSCFSSTDLTSETFTYTMAASDDDPVSVNLTFTRY